MLGRESAVTVLLSRRIVLRYGDRGCLGIGGGGFGFRRTGIGWDRAIESLEVERWLGWSGVRGYIISRLAGSGGWGYILRFPWGTCGRA